MREQETPPIKITILEPVDRLSPKDALNMLGVLGPFGSGGDPEWVIRAGEILGNVVKPFISFGVRAGVGITKEFTVGTIETGIEAIRTAADLLPGGAPGSLVETFANGANAALHGLVTYKVGYKRILEPLIGPIRRE